MQESETIKKNERKVKEKNKTFNLKLLNYKLLLVLIINKIHTDRHRQLKVILYHIDNYVGKVNFKYM